MHGLLLHSELTTVETVFWAACSFLFYVYIGYPTVLASVALFCKPARTAPGYTPTVSVVITSYNEAGAIDRKLHETLALNYPPDKFEVLVVSDGSTDATDSIV